MIVQVSKSLQDLLGVYPEDALVAGTERLVLRLERVGHELHEDLHLLFVFRQNAPKILNDVLVAERFEQRTFSQKVLRQLDVLNLDKFDRHTRW